MVFFNTLLLLFIVPCRDEQSLRHVDGAHDSLEAIEPFLGQHTSVLGHTIFEKANQIIDVHTVPHVTGTEPSVQDIAFLSNFGFLNELFPESSNGSKVER